MALFAGLASLLGRFAGRFLNTTLGWATILLFGKVPQRKQTIVLLIVLGSLAWVALVVGVVFPDVGALLIATVPAPDFIEESWLRLAMLAGALLLPLVIGAAMVFVSVPDRRPRGAALITALLRGYPFTFVLALTIAILAGVVVVRKLTALSRRWEDTHVPVIVKPGAYEEVLADLHSVLGAAGLELSANEAPWVLSAPAKLLDAVAGHALGGLVPDRLVILAGTGLEILVYPSDMAIAGTRERVAQARAAIVSKLVEAPANMTTSAEAQQVEDRIRQLSHGEGALAAVDAELASLSVPFDEWETLYRQRLQVERDLLAGSPHEPPARAERSRRITGQDRAIAAIGLGLIALDLALVLGDRRRQGRG